MELIGIQIKQSVRRLARAPMFTAVTLLTLAICIGGDTAIFSVIDCVLLKPLSYPRQEELAIIKYAAPGWNLRNIAGSASTYFIYRDQSRTFQDIALYTMGINAQGEAVNVNGLGEPERVPAQSVTASMFSILGATPVLGRCFTQGDDQPDAADTVVLAYGYWRSKFAGDRSVLGRTINVDGKLRTIIGVLSQKFQFLDKPKLAMFLPLKLDRPKTYLGGFNYGQIVRLKPGVNLAEANADVVRMLPIVDRSFPPPSGFSLKAYEDARIEPNVRPLKREVIGDVGKVLWVVMGGIGSVLLIACANLGNFLLIRADGRGQEFATRAALGASRGGIATEIFTESLILGLLGGLLGLGLACGALRALVAIAPPGLPRLHEIGIDGNILLFTFTLSLAVSLLFGSVPAFKYTGGGIGKGLSESGRSISESRKRHRTRDVLVVVQLALALILLVSSGLMIRTFRALTRVDPGFVAPKEIQTFSIHLQNVKEPESVIRIEEEILHKVGAIPGVSSAALSRDVPVDGSGWGDPLFAKDRVYAPGELPIARFEAVAPGFFKTLGVPIHAGRDFTWSDIYSNVPVALVSEKLARKYWHDSANALGKEIRVTPRDDWREVVGVVGDIRQDGVDKEVPTSVYWPIYMNHFEGNQEWGVRRNVTYAMRSKRAGSEDLASEMRRVVWSVAPNVPLTEVHTLDYYYTRSMTRISFTLVMLALAGVMALLLGIVGLYGVMAYSVLRRRRELGIRMAFGARKSHILSLVVGKGIVLCLLGIGIGVISALQLMRFLASLLYGIKPTDPLTLVSVSLLLIAVSLIASYIPARQAANSDLMTTLRNE